MKSELRVIHKKARMSDLPTPLISEILSRLPVISLLRFRCISRSWRTLIDSPNFIKLHLENSKKNTTNHSIIFRDCYLYSAEFPALNRAIVINHPLKCDHYGTEIVGSCNGLLCLSNGEEDGLNGTIIYNPATKKHRQLPVSPIEFPDDILPSVERLIYGFGYDKVHDDYKLVRVIQFYCGNPDFFDSEVKVYSLKANCWRRIKDFPREYYLSYKRAWGVYVNGCLHWVVSKNPESDGSKYIMAFDLGSEKLKMVPKPKPLCGKCHLNVEVLRGCLGVLCNYFPIRSDLWIMEQYGVEGSWVKLFSIEQESVLGSFEYVRPIACSKDGTSVLLDKDMSSLFWYNLKTKRAKRVNFTDMPKSFEVQMMVESLVPVDGLKKKKKKAKKKRNEQLGQANNQLSTLPLPLLLDIFCRLPAETILQLTYVCKEWNNLINDPEFAKMHLKGSGKRNDNLYLILRRERLHLIDFNQLNKAVHINHPLVCPKGWTDVLGSCNGLLCLYNEKEDLAIWNPLTGRCHKIPITKYQSPKGSNVFHTFVYGFGYDSINDDYKVVRVLELYSYDKRRHDYFYDEFSDSESDTCSGSEVQVYSLKAKCWRSIKSFPLSLCYICPGVLANGALHWVANKNQDTDSIYESILSFDLGSEECRIVPQPNYADIHFHRSLWVLGGSLCILCHYPRRGVDIWVMKDYEMNTWCKLISITQPKPIKSFEYIKPLAYSKNGTEVLLDLDYKKLIWYNMSKKTIRDVNISGLPESFDSEVFIRSIIDPNNLIPRQTKQLQLGQSSSSFAAFPKKLVSHILRFLPVKNLLQAQCVCKTWYKIINDPEFIEMQLAVSSNCSSSSLLILRGEKLLSLDYQLLDKVVEINLPNLCIEESTDIVGSSNGLLCLCKDRDIALLNPWTGKYERLPSSNFQFHASRTSHSWLIHGFGYDPTSDDYKVVCILQLHNSLEGGSVHSEIQAYSLKSKCWGKIKQLPYIICHPCSGVLANGALHWVARQNPELYSSSNLLLALDFGSEKCRVVTQPSYIDTDFHMSLGSLKGCLSLLCHYPRQSVDIWVMTEYGTESWTKLLTISQPKIIKNFKYLKPLGYSNNGAEVLLEQDNEKFLWFNLVKKTVRYLKVQGLPKSFETVMCSGSLVQIGNRPTIVHENCAQALSKSQSGKDKVRENVDGGFLSKGFKLKL
ncbi:F-box protein CPR1 [Bienertia sinuspersici]